MFSNIRSCLFKKKKDSQKIKVALLIDEFFGAANTAFGGYGFLARNYIAKYLPNEDLQVDVLLGFSKKLEVTKVDDVMVYRLPREEFFARRWLENQDYDLFLSIELTSDSYKILKLNNKKKKLLLWVQDPRPWYEWKEILTVKLFPEPCYWDTEVYEYVHELNNFNKVKFVSQGKYLIDKARDLYRLTNDVEMGYLPNPIDIDKNFSLDKYQKKDMVIFLGRLESVKRGWLFCEIAKQMPELEFYVLGKGFRDKEKNLKMFEAYKEINNLHFVGHVEGEVKEKYLKDAKILVNCSIHEAVPISFLEALSYGTLIVSNRDPDNLTSMYGKYVGEVLGDGFDKVPLYVDAIREIIQDDERRLMMAKKSIQYIRLTHDRKKIIDELRETIFEMLH